MAMKPLRIGKHVLDWGARTYVMGILNVTPDSFSGDGLLAENEARDADLPGGGVAAAVEQARGYVAAGADILDVGGESTRPGSQPLSEDEERQRVIPVIRGLHKEFPDTLISVDTYKAAIAEEALEPARTS